MVTALQVRKYVLLLMVTSGKHIHNKQKINKSIKWKVSLSLCGSETERGGENESKSKNAKNQWQQRRGKGVIYSMLPFCCFRKGNATIQDTPHLAPFPCMHTDSVISLVSQDPRLGRSSGAIPGISIPLLHCVHVLG